MEACETALESPLPSKSEFLTSLINQLSTIQPAASRAADRDIATTTSGTTRYNDAALSLRDRESGRTANPLSRLSASQLSKLEPLMLTLHSLFPNELLLALDILDRKLVQRFLVMKDKAEAKEREGKTDDISSDPPQGKSPEWNDKSTVYFVRSTASTRGDLERSYEVRLRAWNCSCPGFAFSAFGELEPPSSDDAMMSAEVGLARPEEDDRNASKENPWFGGSLTRAASNSSPPVCKHLLACVLASRCPALFAHGMEERSDISKMELAGRCAGWGG
jgi:hypothetical protein